MMKRLVKIVILSAVLSAVSFAMMPMAGAGDLTITDSDAPPMDDTAANRMISISIQRAPILEVIDMLADKGGMNIVVSKSVVGRVSMNLNNISMINALTAVLEVNNLVIKKRAGIMLVKPKAEAGAYASGNIERVFRLNYTNVNDIVKLLNDKLAPAGRVTPIISSSKVVVEAPADQMIRVEKLIKAIDSKPKQVLIEAKILEIRLDDSAQYGINWKRMFTQKSITSGDGVGTIQTSGFAQESTGTGLFFNMVSKNVEFFFDTLKEQGQLKTVATPKVIAVDNKESKIIIGGRLGYRVTTTVDSVTTNSVEFLDIGTQLKLTPHIDADNNILLSIHPEVSNGVVVQGLPTLTTTEVDINVVAKPGDTIFIGGLIKDKKEENVRAVPLLSRIPILGNLFKRKSNSIVRSETIVLLTPYMMNAKQAVGKEKTDIAGDVESEIKKALERAGKEHF